MTDMSIRLRTPWAASFLLFFVILFGGDADAFLERASRRKDPEWWAEHDKVCAELCQLKLNYPGVDTP